MGKSIAEMRQSPHVGRPEASATICVAGKLQAKLDRIDRELVEVTSRAQLAAEELAAATGSDDEDDKPKKPRRLTDKPDPALRQRAEELKARADELAAEADAVRDAMDEHMVDVGLKAQESGLWRQWCVEHPAREGERRDERLLGGICNADDLIADLDTYVITLNDAAPGKGEWEFVATSAAPAALLEVAAKVVGLHETVVSLGKSRRSWLFDRMRSSASDSPSQSEQASDD